MRSIFRDSRKHMCVGNPNRDSLVAVVVGKDGSIVHKRNGDTAADEKTLASEVEKALAN